jgi:CRISPR system Cascade subunit CasB
MNKSLSDPKETAEKFLNFLRQLKNDRGAMADLRRALTPIQRYRAWPVLARFGGINKPRFEIIAGLYAHHPEETSTGNLGTTCRQLSGEYHSFEGRFRRLLCCDREDIYGHIRPIVLAAASKGIRINYKQLFTDLSYWGDSVKARWATEFWGAPTQEVVPAGVEDQP